MTRGRRPMAAPPSHTRGSGIRGDRRLLVALVALGTFVLVGAIALGGVGRTPGSPSTSGVAAAAGSFAAEAPVASPSAVPDPGREVYGFVPYWEMDRTIVDHLAGIRATTVALFSVTHATTGALAMSQTGARRITGPIGRAIIRSAHAHHRRADLVYTSFGLAKNRRLLSSVDLQQRVVAELVALRHELGVDGIAVDLEEVDPADVPAFGSFVARMRTSLRASHRDATVSVATGPGPLGTAMAAAANLAGADRILLMGYDYRTGTSAPGATSPLARGDGDPRTLGWSLDLYGAAGVPPQKTLLGLPLYGISWPTESPDLGSASTGPGAVWIPRRNLPTLHDSSLTSTLDPFEGVEFLAIPNGSGWQAIYWDTPDTLAPKLGLADDRGLAGVGFWALGYDRGIPGYAALIGRFRAGSIVSSAAPSATP